MCHTQCSDKAPWIALEFSGTVEVARVDIYNRGDNNEVAARTKNLEVRLTDELPASKDKMYYKGELLGTYPGQGTKGQIIKIQGPAKTGRYVLVQMNNQDCLNLHEVEAFGTVVSPGNGNDFHLSRTTQ